MKKYWLILLLVFSPSLLFAWGIMGVSGGVVASGGTSETADFYFKLESSGTGVYDEISEGRIGTVNGATYVTGCDNNGMQFDADTEYIKITSSELTTAGLTNFSTGDVHFYYKPTAISGSDQAIFTGGTYGLADYVAFFWDGDSDSRWQLTISEDWDSVTRRWDASDPVVDTCGYYRIVWDLSVPSMTFYKGTTPSNLIEQTGGTISGTADSDSVPLNDLYIGNRDADDTKYAHGIIDDFKWEQ